MAPLPTINDVFRIEVQWNQVGGIKPVNIFHVSTTSSNVQDIGAAIEDAAPSASGMWAALGEGYSCNSLGITPLDGLSPRVDVNFQGDPWHGGYGGQILPAVAAVVTIKTNRRGPRGRGRMFVGPCVEASVDSGHVIDEALTLMRTSWIDFDASLLTGTPQLRLGVASYTHSDFHQSVNTGVDFLVGTQRRRQNQLR